MKTSLDKYCQRTLLIDVPETVQISRTCARDHITEQQAQAILKAQMSRQDKVAKANDIISNAGVIADLNCQGIPVPPETICASPICIPAKIDNT